MILHGYSVNSSRSALQNQVKRSFSIINEIQNTLLDNVVTTEGPLNVESEKLSLQVERVMLKSLGQTKNSLKKCDFQPPGPQAVGMDESEYT